MKPDTKIILRSIANDTIEECLGYIVYAYAKLESLDPDSTEYKELAKDIGACKRYILRAKNFLKLLEEDTLKVPETTEFIGFLLIMLDMFSEKKRRLKEEFLRKINSSIGGGGLEQKETIQTNTGLLLRSMIDKSNLPTPEPEQVKKKKKSEKGKRPDQK